MTKKNFYAKKATKKIAAVLACITVISAAVLTYVGSASAADLYTESDHTCLGSDGEMYTALTYGEYLVQGSISTDVVSDMYIENGEGMYEDQYGRVVTKYFSGSRAQDYSCVAFVRISTGIFYAAKADFTAYDNDGARAHQHLSSGY